MARTKKQEIIDDKIIKLTVSTKGIVNTYQGEKKYASLFQKGSHIANNVHINDKIILMTLLDNARIGRKDDASHLLRFMNKEKAFIKIHMSNACLGINGITIDGQLHHKISAKNKQLISINEQRRSLSRDMDNKPSNIRSQTPFIANEMREPIQAIIGFAEILLHEFSNICENEQHTNYVKNIKNTSNHLLEILNTYTQRQKKPNALHNQDIDSTIVQVIAMTTHLTKSRKVIFTPSLQGAYYSALKSVELKQVLMHLIHNAAKHSEEDSIITIQRHILKNNNLLLTVSDTGMDATSKKHAEPLSKQQAEPPQPFKWQKNALSTANENNVDLSLVLNIVESVKGIISINNKKKYGTIATLIIPLGHNLPTSKNINDKRNNSDNLQKMVWANNQDPSAKLLEKYIGNGKNKQQINKTA